MAAGRHDPPGRNATVTRRLLLVGAFGAFATAGVARLPGPFGAARVPPEVGGVTVSADPPTLIATPTPTPTAAVRYDVVVRGGRAIDPETGLDAVADVGIAAGQVAAISAEPLHGDVEIDATGLVVAPGFIDVLSYSPNRYGEVFKVADGVTTNLCMHGVNGGPERWFARWDAEPTIVHRGGAFDHAWARADLGLGVGQQASSAQLIQLRERATAAVAGGFLGIHLELEYTPGVATGEVLAMGEVAAATGVGLYVHARHADPDAPGTNAEAVAEVLDVARRTGCPVHLEHLTSTGGTHTMEASLGAMQRARDEGLDVTGCLYPYGFWAAYAGSARFDPGWQDRFAIDYDDLVVPGTGASLTAADFTRARRDNLLLAAMAIPEADVRTGLSSPLLMIGSDAILEPGDNNHPRAAGTFSRTLGRYVRDEGVLDLRSALAKMTLDPALRLQGSAPAMARKGRLQVGADADITVFDPTTVADRATVSDPASPSVGIEWVLVDGAVAKDPDRVREDVRVGRSIRSGDA